MMKSLKRVSDGVKVVVLQNFFDMVMLLVFLEESELLINDWANLLIFKKFFLVFLKYYIHSFLFWSFLGLKDLFD
jgi:hypothetical protein